MEKIIKAIANIINSRGSENGRILGIDNRGEDRMKDEEKKLVVKTERITKTEGIIFGGIYKPKPNPFKHSYRAEYTEIILLSGIFVFFTTVLKMGGVI